jgi:hypothetical protein
MFRLLLISKCDVIIEVVAGTMLIAFAIRTTPLLARLNSLVLKCARSLCIGKRRAFLCFTKGDLRSLGIFATV